MDCTPKSKFYCFIHFVSVYLTFVINLDEKNITCLLCKKPASRQEIGPKMTVSLEILKYCCFFFLVCILFRARRFLLI